VLAVPWAALGRPPDETPCEEIPEGSIVFAPAFLHLGVQAGRMLPGQANAQIAEKLKRCAHRFSLVLTQKAVSDALNPAGELPDGTPVLQMHRHDPKIDVRTFAALRCALRRFETAPDRIVLLAHPRHLKRTRMDLRALYDGEIVELHLGKVYYQDESPFRPLQWAIKNASGWIVDYLLALSIKVPAFARLGDVLARFGITPDCPGEVLLPRVIERDGRWETDDASP
jgi:hypothetical protein